MPTVLQVDGFRFFFFSADSDEPAHVHVKKGGGDGKIWLEPNIRVEYLIDFKSQEEKKIRKIVADHKDVLIDKWHDYFQK